MIILHQPKPMFALPSSSPFCLKLEAFLRLNEIDFKTQHALPHQGPFKKIPFIDYNNQILGDSTSIIDQLITDFNIQYDEHLNLNIGHSFSRMMEEHIYWVMVYFRWMHKPSWQVLKKAFFSEVPFIIRPLISNMAWSQAKRTLYGQGLGRLPESMILQKAKKDLDSLEYQLTQSKFICGDSITHYDLSIWAVLSQFMQSNFNIKLSEIVNNNQILKQYIERINNELSPCWQDFELFKQQIK